MEFPFGRVPLCMAAIALVSTAVLFGVRGTQETSEPDLMFYVFAKLHHDAYQQVVPEFERLHNCKVRILVVNMQTLQGKLNAAMQSGVQVPDLVEIERGNFGFFIKGPLDEIGFVDLTDRIRDEGLDQRMVESRFSLWSSRGRIFGLPHDVHPVVLGYNTTIIDELGIDVEQIRTWDDFVEVAHRITQDINGDGAIDRFAIDFADDGTGHVDLLIAQRGAQLFDEYGNLTMVDDRIVDTIVWYVHQTRGKGRISFPAGNFQASSMSMKDDLIAFYLLADWRVGTVKHDVPGIRGRMKLMPLPAWEEGGRRTSTWGGTGLCITKASKNRELAWEFAKFIYSHQGMAGKLFQETAIISPFKDTWDAPEYLNADPFFGDQHIGGVLTGLAPQTPAQYSSEFSQDAFMKLYEAIDNSAQYYMRHGDDGFREFVRQVLEEKAGDVRRLMEFDVFLRADATPIE